MSSQRAVIMDVSTAAAWDFVVVAFFHGLRTQYTVEVVAIRLLVDPGSNSGEHVAMNFEVLVTQSWVVENAENVGHDFVNRDSWILPCVEHTAMIRQYRG
jgi:hypothetical protein